MWTKTQWNRNIKWLITGIVCLVVFSAMINNSSSKSTNASAIRTTLQKQISSIQATLPPQITPQATATPQPTNTPAPTATPVPTDANGFPMDYETVTVAQIAKMPSAYEEKTIVFTCTVIGFVKGDNGDAAGFNCSDPSDISSLLQVDAGSLFDYTKINQDDTVKIYGTGRGAANGKNAFGGDVTEAVVDGLFINDLTSGYKN